MLISRLRIRNFKSIRSLDLELGGTTVLIGPNNAGKTAILEAIRIALTRRWGQKGTGFTEYDIHLPDELCDPKTSDPVVIEVEFEERVSGEWPVDLQADLDDIVQTDPVTGKASILLRVSCAWDATSGSYVPRWEFLNAEHVPLTGRAARATNLQEFFQYLPVFYLDALRDASDEFSPRSQFWGRLLRSVQIPEALERRAKRVFDLLNTRLLAAHPRLSGIATTLSTISRVAATDDPGRADLRMVPLRPLDLLSRAEVVYRCQTDKPWLPLPRHGQGVQSLSVMFLFRAFVDQVMAELYKPDSSPVLELEEPETHLHPQAARTLWRHVSELPGQKLVTTHSPYFLQHVPFRDLRIVRLTAAGTAVFSLPSHFSVAVPHVPELVPLIATSCGSLRYDGSLGQLVVQGKLEQKPYRELLVAYARHADRAEIHKALKRLYEESAVYMPDEDLEQLETFARRIRGEIFFAQRWLLVEGQAEYFIAHGIGAGLGYNLDEHGVSVIDIKNNGNASCFAALARALGIPWVAVFDGDDAGQGYVREIQKRGFSAVETDRRCACLPEANLEAQLIKDGLQAELKEILDELGVKEALTLDDEALLVKLTSTKSAYAAALGRRCARDPALTARMPAAYRDAIGALKGLS
ncbi:AAA family ATPase (plasmid) [Azospirillum sp. A29]|uniref:ATP-dependent nuclease n=1 Tax=Azospirillum sp. A29 TaxID=3160606 RepID=UPI00366ABF95